MSADKKINPDELPHPQKEDKKMRNQEEFDDKSKTVKKKTVRVNYIIKDLPIY